MHLGFLCKLKNVLDLPINLENMLYFACSCIKDEDLKNAKEKVEEKLKLEKAIPEFLATNATWRKTLTALKPKEMDKISEKAERAYEADSGKAVDAVAIEENRKSMLADLSLQLLKRPTESLPIIDVQKVYSAEE